MQTPAAVKSKLRTLPDRPGCYLMRDKTGKIIYVGKAASLRKRVRSYFRAATFRSAPPRLRSLVHSIADFDIIVARSEPDALLTENKLIKDYQPRFNVLLRDDKRFPLLRLDALAPWPRLTLCRIKRNDAALYFGPYVSSAAARAAMEFTENKFGLRKCADPAPGPETHRHCLNDVIRFCSAPCLGKISRSEYSARVDEAAAFLRGERPALLEEVRARMDQAAAQMDFEKAAALRDTLLLLHAALRRKAHLARTGGVSPARALEGLAALRRELGLEHAPRLIHAFDISNISGKHAVGSMVAAVDGICRPALYRRFRITTVEAADDPAMMAEVVRRHFKRLRDENRTMPGLLLVDGGITQLRAARAALRELGITGVPAAGLAKKLEEIYLHEERGCRKIMLPPQSPALQVLQRLRDEAHRFAVAYHRRVRAGLIRSSALDEVRGMGEERKKKLFRHFGSLKAMAAAHEKDIAAVPGIGPALARQLKVFLKSL
ncbi:MAG: excinuclease ABC subunit UvrC [Kiritimatiellia bacterium]